MLKIKIRHNCDLHLVDYGEKIIVEDSISVSIKKKNELH